MDETVKEKKLLGKLVLELGIVLTFVHIVAVMLSWYHRFPWIDIPQHFFGGVLAALIFYWLNYRYPKLFKLVPGVIAPGILVVSWAALLGVLFEFTEFLYDIIAVGYLGIGEFPSQLGLKDTMGDLFFDILGGLALAILMRLRYDKRKRQL